MRVALGILLAMALGGIQPAVANWKGSSEVGIVFARGNSDTDTANVKLELSTERDRWKHGFNIAALRSSNDGLKTAQRYGAGWQSDFALSERNYLFGGLRYEDDEFSGFDYQASATAGIGHKFIDTATTRFNGQIGAGYRRSKDALSGATNGEPVLRGDLAFETAVTATTKLINKFVVEAGSDNTFASNEFALQVRMSDAFALSLGLGARFNSDPPLGLKKTDTLTTVNLVYGF